MRSDWRSWDVRILLKDTFSLLMMILWVFLLDSQELKRVFGWFSNFGLAASMISVLLGIIPLYSYSLSTGGPAVMFWGWIVIGLVTLILVSSLAEISSAFPTMGALYYWAYQLGGPKYGPFASWMAGWSNLLGQIAGVASGGYAAAQVVSSMIQLNTGYQMSDIGNHVAFSLNSYHYVILSLCVCCSALIHLCYHLNHCRHCEYIY